MAKIPEDLLSGLEANAKNSFMLNRHSAVLIVNGRHTVYGYNRPYCILRKQEKVRKRKVLLSRRRTSDTQSNTNIWTKSSTRVERFRSKLQSVRRI